MVLYYNAALLQLPIYTNLCITIIGKLFGGCSHNPNPKVVHIILVNSSMKLQFLQQ